MPSPPPYAPPRRRLFQYLLLAVLLGLGLIVSHEVRRSLRLTRLHKMGAMFDRWTGPMGLYPSFLLGCPCLVEPQRMVLGFRLPANQAGYAPQKDPRLPELLRRCTLLENVSVCAEWAQVPAVSWAIVTLPNLQSLTLTGPGLELGAGAWRNLDRMEHLGVLTINSGVSLTEAGWTALSTLPHLLELQFENLTDADMAHLSRLPHLRRLVVLRSPQFTAASLPHLQKIATLTSLQLTQTGVSESDAAAFKLALAKVDVQWAAEESGI